MDSSFGALDAFAFVVFAVLIFVGVVIVVNLGKLPGQARAQMAAPAGWRDQRHELDRNCDRRHTLADRVHLGVYDADWRQACTGQRRSAAAERR